MGLFVNYVNKIIVSKVSERTPNISATSNEIQKAREIINNLPSKMELKKQTEPTPAMISPEELGKALGLGEGATEGTQIPKVSNMKISDYRTYLWLLVKSGAIKI